MRRSVPKAKRKSVATPTSPINFRMPKPLRLRLGRYARGRHLTEAEALRAALSEHLDEIESAAELAAAERWQYEQAYATWDGFRRGRGRTVPRERIDKIFRDALAEQPEDARRKA